MELAVEFRERRCFLSNLTGEMNMLVSEKCSRGVPNRRRPVGLAGDVRSIGKSRINQSRWFDPTVGRWLSEDPSGLAAGDPNFYRYCGNAPTNGIDPSGMVDADVPATQDVKVKNGSFRVDLSPVAGHRLKADVSFTPDHSLKLKCARIRFVQIVRITDKDGKPVDWSTFKSTLNDAQKTAVSEKDRNAMLTSKGWVVDVLTWMNKAGKGSPAHIFYADYVIAGTMEEIGSEGFGTTYDKPAVLHDMPGTADENRYKYEFESYVYALPLLKGQDNPGEMADADAIGMGPNSSNAPTDLRWRDDRSVFEGKAVLLGGVSWGFLNMREPKYIKAGGLEQASDNLTEAIKNFQAFYWPKP